MYQRFIAVGRLGRDPEVSTTPNGTKLATVSLATSEYVKGEERTEWHRIVVWDEKLIEVLERRARKGTLVVVEGQVRSRRWQKEGREIVSTEIVLDRFNSRLQILTGAKTPEPEETDADENGGREAAPGRTRSAEMDFEDELPF